MLFLVNFLKCVAIEILFSIVA